jgi:hypothetical protein
MEKIELLPQVGNSYCGGVRNQKLNNIKIIIDLHGRRIVVNNFFLYFRLLLDLLY